MPRYRLLPVKVGDEHQARFQLVGDNGEPQSTSEPYATESSLRRGIRAHRRNAATVEIDDRLPENWWGDATFSDDEPDRPPES